MRILHISSARTRGGGERHLSYLVRGLAARGHTLYVALSPTSPLHEDLGELGDGRLVTLPLRNALDLASAHKLSRFIRAERIEIVHAHMARDYTLAAYASRLAPPSKLILTRHVLFPLGRVHALTLRQASRVIAVSEAVARALRAHQPAARRKIAVVRNAIDIERFEAARSDHGARAELRRSLLSSAPPARLLVGTVGELSVVKAQEMFVRAASILARSMRQDVEFVIVGEDASRSGETRRKLEELVDESGMRGRVHMLGRRADVADVLCALDVFVSTSRTEAFGLAMVEAMACGVPVVATETEGAREIIEDGVTGRLVPRDDPQALAASLSALLEDADGRARLSEAANAAARERFSLARMIDETETLYLEALRG